MKNKINSVKRHIVRNRGRYCFVAGFATASYVGYHARKDTIEFLEEHNLLEEFLLAPEDR